MAKDISRPDQVPGPGGPTGGSTNQPDKLRRSRASAQAVTRPGPESVQDKAPPPGPTELDWPAPLPRDSRLGRYEPIRRSGGPRTEAGRAVASRNAVTHGAYAMPPSSSQEYEQHLVNTERYFKPSGPVESHLVSQIAHEMWRLGTIDRYERCAVAMMDASEPAAPLIARAVGFPYGPEHHHLLCRPDDLMLRRRLSWRLDDLGLSAGDGLGPLPELARAIRRLCPDPDIDAEEALMRRVDDALRLGPADLCGALQARLNGPGGQELLAEYWVFRNLQAVTRERWILVNSRVLELLSNPALVRARQATGAALLRWHDSLIALRQTSPHGFPLPGARTR